MIFVHTGVENEIGHVSENRVNEEALESFCLTRERKKNCAVADAEQDLVRPDNDRFTREEDVDLSVSERSVFVGLDEMKRPRLQPTEI